MRKLIPLALIFSAFFGGSNVVMSAPTKGVQAILLHYWSDASVRNLSNVLRNSRESEIEVSFAPNVPNQIADPYRNIKTLIKNLNGKKTLYVTVYLGFHSYSRSPGCGNSGANSYLGLFVSFFNVYKDNPKVKIIVSPSLEDCGTTSDVEGSALEIARLIGVADIGKLILRRSPNKKNSERAPSGCYTNSEPIDCAMNAIYKYGSVEIEKHGGISNGSGATVYSNDGVFVWDNVSKKQEKRGSFKNADGTTSPQYALTRFASQTDGKRTNLWRPAYNLFRGSYEHSSGRVVCSDGGYVPKDKRKFGDCNNQALGSIEMAVLKKFLAPVRTTLQLGGTTAVDLSPGDNISSENDEVTLMFQTDGNVVLYNNDTGQALWHTGTGGRTDATRFVMQSDGNLVLYAGATPLWNAGIISPNAYLLVQDDHNLVIYSTARVALWHTATTNQ